MKKKTILVAEDEMLVAMTMRDVLINVGYDVPDIVTTGQDAVNKALEISPDLILININIGGDIDGINAVTSITEILDIPIIYVTTNINKVALQRVSKTSLFSYIIKPFKEQELCAITESILYRHQCEQLAKSNQRWLLAILNSISEGVIAIDHQEQIKFMNPMAETLTNWLQSEAIGLSVSEVLKFIDELTKEPLENPISKALLLNCPINSSENTLLVTKKGKVTPVACNASPIHDQQGNAAGAVVVFQDVTEQRQLQAKLEHNALHDVLTQLPNRALFLNRLQQAVDRNRRLPEAGFAIMLLDLDHFKVINDTCGHATGDALLIALAPRLQTHLRMMDTVARLGGDEFAILLESVDGTAIACRTAERILGEVSRPFVLDNHEFFVTASIGIVLSHRAQDSATDLLRNADIALYRAKHEGRGNYQVFDAAMHHQAMSAMRLEHSLRQAIARQELQVHFQPIVTLATQELVSLEALVRWQKPGEGLIYPEQFVAIAEETGLINAIDQQALQESCRQLKRWQQHGNRIWILDNRNIVSRASSSAKPLTVAVNFNLCRAQLLQNTLVPILADALEANHLSGHDVKIEITEEALVSNHQAMSKIFSDLKALGIQICLDDFGTGYSSLNYLHRFPIDIVKIDKSFIQGMESSREKVNIVSTIINLCRYLSIEVIAEGIETQRQAEMLLDMGCEHGQGYFFAEGLPAEGLTQLLFG